MKEAFGKGNVVIFFTENAVLRKGSSINYNIRFLIFFHIPTPHCQAFLYWSLWYCRHKILDPRRPVTSFLEDPNGRRYLFFSMFGEAGEQLRLFPTFLSLLECWLSRTVFLAKSSLVSRALLSQKGRTTTLEIKQIMTSHILVTWKWRMILRNVLSPYWMLC